MYTLQTEAGGATGAISREALQASEMGTTGNYDPPYKKRCLSSCAGRGRQGRKLHLNPGKGSNYLS